MGTQVEPLNLEDAVRALRMIADDMKHDASSFDGRPFNGRTVAEYFGNQGAAIAAIANIVRLHLQSATGAPEDAT